MKLLSNKQNTAFDCFVRSIQKEFGADSEGFGFSPGDGFFKDWITSKDVAYKTRKNGREVMEKRSET